MTNRTLEYAITGGNTDQAFSINSSSGQVSLSLSLDRETTPTYSLTITVVDAGSMPSSDQSAVAMVTVTVDDVNDSPPLFSQSVYNMMVSETVAMGTIIVNTTAIDSDEGSNAVVGYSLNDPSLLFAVEPATGQVVITGALDYETQQQHLITVVATDGGQPPLSSSASIVIAVINVNDERPFFTQLAYHETVSELFPASSTLLTLVAMDPDTPNTTLGLSYTISSNGEVPFIIQQSSGAVVSTSTLDYEMVQSYSFQVVVTDGQTNTNPSGTATVVVTVTDVNDNPPKFLHASGTVTLQVPENVTVGEEILNATARDPDSSVNGLVSYSINSSTFSVALNGSLLVAASLDRETASMYSFIITATDGGTPSLSSTLLVVIVVTDVNDNPPLFSQDGYSISISESHPVNSSLLMLTASDRDVGSNAELVYSLAPSGPFLILPQTSDIILAQSLDYETTSQYNITVAVSDMGTPPLSSITTISITVLDYNDHSPVFSQDAYALELPESAPIGQFVVLVMASDADSGDNAAIEYSITVGNNGDAFSINSSTGELTTVELLDFEITPVYELSVAARNYLADPSLVSSVTVRVQLTDSNEFPPSFSQSLYTASIQENLPSDTLVTVVSASDQDGGSAGSLLYSLNGDQPFSISSNGTIITTQSLDREALSDYLLVVVARDLGSPSLSSSATVNVAVLDVNDSPPSLSSSLYISLLPENSPSSTLLILSPPLVATDDDSPGPNSLLVFSLTGVAPPSSFSINPSTGQILTAAPLDYELINQTEFTVVVMDTGSTPLSSSALVRVIITDQNDHPPAITGLPAATVFTEGQNTLLLAASAVVTDQDDLPLQMLAVAIVDSNGAPSTYPDLLSFSLTILSSLTISSDNNGRSLSIQGTFSTQQATSLLQSLVFTNTQDEPDPVPRYILVTVSDGVFTTSSNVTMVTIQAVNDHAPQLSLNTSSGSGNVSVVFPEGAPPTMLTGSSVLVSDSDSGPHDLVLRIILQDPLDGEREALSLSGTPPAGISVVVSNHSITAQGSAPFSSFEEFLLLLCYSNTADEPTGSSRLVTFSLSDGSLSSGPRSSMILIQHINDPPLLDLGGGVDYEVVFIEGRGPVDLASSAFSLTDSDSSQLVMASIELLNNLDGSDEMITLSSASLNVTVINTSLITLSGPASVDQFAQALRSAQYSNSLMAPSSQRRDVLFTVSDGQSSATATAFISFSLVNDPPIVDLNGPPLGNDFMIEFTEGSQPVHPFSTDLIIRDIDSPLLSNATITLSPVLDQEGLTSSFNDASIQLLVSADTIVLVGLASTLRYTTALSTIFYYNNASEPSGGVRVIQVTVNDGQDNSTPAVSMVTVTPINDPPVIDSMADPTAIQYIEESPAVEVLPDAILSDSDNNTLSYLTVTISGLADGELESLSFTDPSSEQVLQVTQTSLSPDTRQYTFSFTSSSTLELFQQLLSSMSYRHSSPEPTAGVRSITMSVSDGQAVSNDVITMINVTLVNDNAPVFTSGGPVLQATVPENTVDIDVVTIATSDEDTPTGPYADDGIVMYSITAGNSDGFFTIHPTSGAITIEQPLDREGGTSVFILTVTAANPVPLSTGASFPTISVIVTVTDLNDNAPQWTASSYQFSVTEHSSGVVGSVSATDSDAGVNNIVRYSIAAGDLTSMFTISPVTGVIAVSNSTALDREVAPSYLLTIEATDLGVPQLVNLTTLSITVLDINDNTPLFSQPSYAAVISEAIPIGFSVLSVVAVDPDNGVNGTIVYSSSGSSAFSVNSSSGEVMTATSLDRETQASYTFTITARDEGTPSLSSSTTVTITVADSNDHTPQFNQTSYSVKLSEDTPTLQSILTVTATDQDTGNNSLITYTIISFGEEPPFMIDPLTGVITVTAVLDREQVEAYLFSVMATDQGVPILSSTANITIAVEDVNDNVPQFNASLYIASLIENSPLNTSIIVVAATDLDQGSNGTITFSVIGAGPFFINSSTGEVFLSGSVDREDQAMYSLMVVAADQGNPSLSSQAQLTITIADQNDNSPVFSLTHYTFSAVENLASQNVGQVTATDSDTGTNAAISYSLSEPSLPFAVNSSTGELSAVALLDREADAEYNFTVLARDGGTPSLSAAALVTVTVTDTNDHTPSFPMTSYSLSVSEALPISSTLIQLQASDDDAGSNGDIIYSITSDGTLFSIDPLSGVLSLTQPLDAEVTTAHMISVTAADHGTPPRSSSVNLTVLVSDVNDNPIMISVPSDSVSFTEQGQDVSIATGAMVTDLDVLSVVTSVMVQLVNCTVVVCEGRLVVDPAPKLSIAEDGRSISVSGNVTAEEAEFILGSARYQNLNAEFQSSSQTVLVSVSDGVFISQASVTIVLVPVNDNAPVVDLDSSDNPLLLRYQTTFTEDSNGALISSSPTVTDADTPSGPLDHITITILNPFDDPMELITASSAGNVTVFPASGGVSLQLLGPASLQEFTATLSTTRYHNQADNPTVFFSRSVEVRASDGQLLSAPAVTTITLQAVNDPPVLRLNGGTAVNYSTVFVEDGGPVSLTSSSLLLSDPDSFTLTQARVELLNPSEDDYLVAPSQSPLALQLVSNHLITVTTPAPLNQYSLFLRGIRYGNNASNPSNDTRTILVTVSDGQLTDTAAAIVSIEQRNDPPLVTPAQGSVFFTEQGPPVGLPAITITDPDSSLIQSVTATIISPSDGSSEQLYLTASTAFSLSGNGSHSLSLQFSAPPIQYETALASLMYNNDALELTGASRIIHITADDGGSMSLPAIVEVVLVAVDDPPAIMSASPLSILYLEESGVVHLLDSTAAVVDGDSPSLSHLTVSLEPVLDPSHERVVFSNASAPQLQLTTDNDGVLYNLSFPSPQPVAVFTQLLLSLGYSNTAPEPSDQQPRQVSITVSDFTSSSEPVTAIINITLLDDNQPIFASSSYTFSVLENSSPGHEVGQVSASDLDDGDAFLYSIQDGGIPFSINSSNGLVYVSGSLDRESQAEYLLTAILTQAQIPFGVFDSRANISISVLDINEPPLFNQSSYEVSIAESAHLLSLVDIIPATDSDADNNAVLSYSLQGTSELSVDNSTGTILVAALLDRETQPQITFNITATDAGTPPLSAVAMVTLTVLDSNDHAPVFTSSLYTAQLIESDPANTSVVMVTATDADEGTNAQVTFSLAAHETPFTISSTGLVSVAGSLAPLQYNLTVIASDGGNPQQQSSATILVTVISINDTLPFFTQSVYQANVIENTALDTPIISVSASDPLTDQPVMYSIAPADVFSINSSTGEVTVAASLDRETLASYTLQLSATSSDSDQVGQAQLVVAILDANDFPPQFNQSGYSFTLAENTMAGTLLGTVLAVDSNDEGINAQVISYTSLSELFSVSDAGEVSALQVFDREEQSEYLFTILAADAGTPPLTGTANVTVTITDTNDNAPSFNQLVYTVSVPESITMGTMVTTVLASDVDIGSNSVIQYSTNSSLFVADGETGAISTAGVLDYETASFYVVEVLAVDGGVLALSGSAIVLITVTNVDDTAPVFTDQVYTAQVPEQQAPPTFLLTLQATDVDSNTAINPISYQILSGDSNGLFSLNESTGVLQTLAQLDRETTSQHTLTVAAANMIDNGTIVSSVAMVTVLVEDINDNPPSFVGVPIGFIVPENAPASTVVGVVIATDSDTGFNGTVDGFSLTGAASLFTISSSGVITVSNHSTLDREAVSSYTVLVSARDGGTPSFTAVINITITLSDINDNPPLFDGDTSYSVPENVSVGDIVFTVITSDADTDSNAVTRYLIPTTPLPLPFAINATTGDVILTGSLDYETTPSYDLVVTAIDSSLSSLNTTNTLIILVEDVDDTPPTFEPSMYSVSVFESAGSGTSLVTVSAQDPDSPSITYSLVDAPPQFFIVSSIGAVFINSPLDREQQSQYTLTVTAVSFPSPPATGIITIEVLDVNDVRPYFSQPQYVFTISEATQPDAVVGTVVVMDDDLDQSGEIALFYLSPSHPLFELDNSTGALSLVGAVDYETLTNYTLTVVAVDGGPSPLTGSVEVLVQLLDVNDNRPVFIATATSITISDSVTENTTILTVQATDSDSGVNGQITYRIQTAAPLMVNGVTGEVAVGPDLVAGIFSVLVTVTDDGSPSLSSQLTLTLTVTDTNEPPLFPNALYTAEVSEGEPVDAVIVTVTAIDVDIGSNAVLTYSIEQNPVLGINSSSGGVFLLAQPDYEQTSTYLVTITAVDQGDVPLSATAMLRVTVLDENDNTPIFLGAPYSAFVSEDASPGLLVLSVNATDSDSTSNGALSYSIADSSFFSIDISSGDVIVSQDLDREVISEVTLTVEVRDGGQPFLTNTTTITISISDVDDNPPLLSASSLAVAIPEDLGIDASVAAVMATDADSGTNAAILYRLINSSVPFAINESTGLVSVSGPGLDRELVDAYSFIVEAYNPFSAIFTSTVTITITVLDVNDNPPRFLPSANYSFSVSESLSPGLSIGFIMAMDPDSGANGSVFYLFNTTVFSVDGDSGEVTLTTPLDYESAPLLMIEVFAADQGSPVLRSTAIVTIEVQNANDNVPVVTSDTTTFIYTEGSSGVAIGNSIAVSDADDLQLVNATVQLLLSDLTTPPDNDFILLTPSSLSMTTFPGSLTLHGPASLEVFATHLQRLQYGSSADEPSLQRRLVRVTVCDGVFMSDPLTLYIDILPVNDHAPLLDLDPSSESRDIHLTYTEGAQTGLQLVPANVHLTDADVGNNTISFITVTLLNQHDQEEQLHSDTALVQIHQLNSTSLNLTGPASISVFREALLSITYSNTAEEPSNASLQRRVQFIVNDGDLASLPSFSLVTISLTNDPPVLLPGTSVLTYSDRDNSAQLLTNDLVFYDVDSASIAFVRVTVVNFLVGVEELLFQPSQNISDQMVGGALTLTGPAPVSAFRDILLSLEYINEDINESLPANFTGSKRVQFVANDGFISSAVSEVIVTFVGLNDAPLVDLNGPDSPGADYAVTFTEEGAPVIISSSTATIMDVDSTQLASATITITSGRHDGTSESLNLTLTSSLVAVSYTPTTGQLVLSGPAPVSDYQLLLRSIAYYNADPDPTPGQRTVTMVINDGAANSFPATTTVTVATINDPPQLLATPLNISFVEQGDPVLLVTPTSIIDPDNTLLASIRVSLSPYPDGNDEMILFIGNLTGLAVDRSEALSSVEFTFTFVPQALGTIAQYLTLLSGLSYQNTAAEPDDMPRQATITISDGELTSSTLSLTIPISLVNDNPPLFTQQTITATLPEDAAIGRLVTVTTATDADAMSDIMYSLSGSDQFTINGTTGLVSVSGSLDREATPLYSLTITASDEVHNSSQSLVVTVTDINDNAPLFNGSFSASVSENSALGLLVAMVTAQDADEGQNAVLEYRIASGNTGGVFSIDASNGSVGVAGDIDYESIASYNLTIEARDSGVPQLTGSTTLLVSIINANDNSPLFSSETVAISISENTSLDHIIYTAVATDQDGDSISYLLSDSGLFSIDPLLGNISVVAELDREEDTVYSLTVLAVDSGTPSLTASLNLTISLTDVDDNPPSFENSSYAVSISEDISIPFFLLDLVAEDPDEGPNAAVVYSIMSGDPLGQFSISQSGTVSVVGGLDREQLSSYQLVIRAQSIVTPSYHDNATLTITVIDVNDNPPVFPQNSFIVTVTENTTIGTIVGLLSASDADEGMNAVTSYLLQGADGVFNITDNGDLVLAESLDREEDTTYSFTVVAVDTASPSLTTMAGVLVLVEDINEFPPIFQQSLIQASLMENAPSGAQLATLLATDPDDSPVTNISYSLSSDHADLFSVDTVTGVVTTLTVFDYEADATSYNITVIAADTIINPMTSTATIELTILDVNEFAPQFSDSFITASVSESASDGHLVTTVLATDGDGGSTGIVVYRLIGPITNVPFALDMNNGEVTVNGLLDREAVSSYNITIEAYNTGINQLLDSVTISIMIIDVNDNSPVFSQDGGYSAVIPSNLPTGSSVLQVTASDVDEGTNAAIQYSIVNDSNVFQLASTTGVLTTLSPLTSGVYDLMVLATDSGQPPRTSSTSITVTIVAPFSVDFSVPSGPGLPLEQSSPSSQLYGLLSTHPPGSSGTLSAQLGGLTSSIEYQTSFPSAHSVEGIVKIMKVSQTGCNKRQ